MDNHVIETEDELLEAIKTELEVEAAQEDLAIELEEEEAIELAWNGNASRYTDEQYIRACLIKGTGKSDSHLPVREPGGKLNCGGVSAAASRINQVSASPEAKKAAASKLIRLMSECGSEPSDELRRMAGQSPKKGTSMSERFKEWFQQGLAFFKEEEPTELVSEEEEGETPVNLAYQLPVTELESEKKSALRFRRPILPIGQQVSYKDKSGAKRVLHFTRDFARQMITNFKEKAFPQVPLLALHPKDSAVNPDHYFGEVVDLESDDQWVYATFDTTPRGAQTIADNPKLPVSVGFFEDRVRQADQKTFPGPSLQHIATTYTPHIPDLGGGWATVQMTSDAAEEVEVMDLTGAEFSAARDPGKESGPAVDDAVAKNETQAEGVNKVELSDEIKALVAQQLAAKDAEIEGLKSQVTELSSSNDENTRARREQQVDLRLATEFANVPPYLKSQVREMLLSDMVGASFVELSEENGDVKQKSVSGEEKLWGILKFAQNDPGMRVELGESGDEDVDPEPEDDHQKIIAFADEQGLDYRDAMMELSKRGEVTF